MSGALHRRALLPAVAVLAIGLTACSGSEEPADPEVATTPAGPVGVPLAIEGVPDGLKIGVLVSLTGTESGSQWREAAEGARVAAYRLGLGGADVELLPVDDKGTREGAADAVTSLADDGVSGIVVATSGPHVVGAINAAKQTGVPALLPYTPSPFLPEGAPVWLTGPDQAAVSSALTSALETAGATKPVLIDAGGPELPDVEAVEQLTFTPGPAGDRAARQVQQLAENVQADSVVVSGSAAQEAQVLRALQGAGVSLRVFLTPDALSPVLADDLVEAGGTLAVDAVTVGTAAGDVTAMTASARGDALSAYFAALRAAAGDPDLQDLFESEPFADVASAADLRSHDAVVALVDAAVTADSTEPTAVARALGGLQLGREQGFAGSILDFTQQAALPPGDVVPLQATTQDTGLRPGGSGAPSPALYWFAVPRG